MLTFADPPSPAIDPLVMTTRLRLLLLLAYSSVALAAFYSTLLPGFACTTQDATCAALGDLFASTGGPGWAVTGRTFTGWLSAAAGATKRLCVVSALIVHHIHRNGL